MPISVYGILGDSAKQYKDRMALHFLNQAALATTIKDTLGGYTVKYEIV